jgi:hypothetical protein
MTSKDYMNMDVNSQDEKIGKVSEMEMDSSAWKFIHPEIELIKNTAESVLGAMKGGAQNMLAISAFDRGIAGWNVRGLNLKFSAAELHP